MTTTDASRQLADHSDTIREIHVEVKRCPDCGARFGVDAAFCPFCGVALVTASWDPTRDALVGKIIDGRYEVHEPLGEGGMGTVYKVRHVTLDRAFAMKVLRRDLATDGGLSARFVQEARATAAIKNPGVVAITDFGVVDDGIPYFVMELLVGETLAVRMRGRGPMPPRDVIGIVKKIAAALQASHDAGVVHRDLKPENVFLVGKMTGKNAEDEVRLVDFGAAKVVGGSKLTRPGVVFGTPYYMSPEQASGQGVDARADIYSLGVLAYEMLTGVVPFEADSYMGVLTQHMFASPTKPSEKLAGIQLGELEDVIMKALEKEPSARHSSMTELASALERAGKRLGSSRPRPSSPGRPPVAKLSTAERIELSVTKTVLAEEKRKRSRAIAIAIVAAVGTLGLGALAIAVFGGRDVDARTMTITTPPVTAPPPLSASVPPPATVTVPPPTPPSAAIPETNRPPATAEPKPRPRVPTPALTPPPTAKARPASTDGLPVDPWK